MADERRKDCIGREIPNPGENEFYCPKCGSRRIAAARTECCGVPGLTMWAEAELVNRREQVKFVIGGSIELSGADMATAEGLQRQMREDLDILTKLKADAGPWHILRDGEPVEVTYAEFAEWVKVPGGNRVESSTVHGFLVNTVFAGSGGGRYGGWFETHVWAGPLAGYRETYGTIQEARLGHERVVVMVSEAGGE